MGSIPSQRGQSFTKMGKSSTLEEQIAAFDSMPKELRQAVSTSHGRICCLRVQEIWQKFGLAKALDHIDRYNADKLLDRQRVDRLYLRELENRAMDREFGL